LQKIFLAGTKWKQLLKIVNDIIHLTFVVMILPVIFLMQCWRFGMVLKTIPLCV
jgi:hypothetical protein